MAMLNLGGSMHTELVIFGLVGTTLADDGLFEAPLRATLADAGLAPSDDAIDAVAGLATPDALRALLGDRGDEGAARHDALVRRVIERALDRTPIREVLGASPAFWQLRKHGVKVASLTGFTLAAAEAIHTRVGWRSRGLVDVVVSSDEVERGAPHADAIHEAMNRAGVRDPSRVVVVGSTPRELEQGTVAGCGLVVGVFDTGGSFDALRATRHDVLLPTCALVPELLRRIDARRIAPIAFGWSATDA
jgi:phosphonatase-like hydrolase